MGIDIALTKVMAFLRQSDLDLSNGYVLDANKLNDGWWFRFVFLPLSPDKELVVTITGAGAIYTAPGLRARPN